MSDLRVECGHQPRGWSFVATGSVGLLFERPEQDPLVERCTVAAGEGDLDDVLDALLRAGWRTLPDFTAVDLRTRAVLARGTAHADARGPGPSGLIRNTGRAPWNDVQVDETVELVVLHGDEDVPAAAPEVAPGEVLAVSCPGGHLNPPEAVSCRVCGQQVAPQRPVSAQRPALGLLVGPAGEQAVLDRDVLVGRAPQAPEGTAPDHEPHLLRVVSPSNDVSRSHVRVHVDGWQVTVSDLGSTNGTVATGPDGQAVELQPQVPHPIEPGTRLSLGSDVSLTYRAAGA